MNEAHELAEKIEQAAHGSHGGGHHGSSVGRLAGITMAILGVMLALCAALVGGARTELIATMVEQSNTFQKYQAQRMKHRMMIAQLATLHALSPSRKDLQTFEDDLGAVRARSEEDKTHVKAAIEASTKALVRILEPRAPDEKRLLEMTKGYEVQTEAAEKWAESYEEAVQAHTDAAEHFEWGQLAAEIGIVVASVSLLLSNRKAWFLSVALGATCAAILLWTYFGTRSHIHHAEDEIKRTKAGYLELREKAGGDKDDEEILSEVETRIGEMTGAEAPAPAAAHHD